MSNAPYLMADVKTDVMRNQACELGVAAALLVFTIGWALTIWLVILAIVGLVALFTVSPANQQATEQPRVPSDPDEPTEPTDPAPPEDT